MPAVTGTRGVTPTTTTPSSGPISCGAFKSDPVFGQIATGAVAPIGKGAPKSETVKTMQAALFSLGFIAQRKGIDGSFGPGTEASLKAFQKSAGVVQSGQLDPATLRALDSAASKQIATLKGQTKEDGSKRQAFHIVADISDPTKTRLYVLDSNDKVQARYLTSPGRAEFPTQGNGFKVTDVMTRKPWNPPNSGWAANAKPIPPGIDNPMGLTKLSLGAYSQYIHGIPASEEPELGHAASHGCLRMSGSNVLELAEKYAGTGSDVKINRDRSLSTELSGKFDAAHLSDRPTDAGREYLFGYLSGELGSTRHFNG
ncbi:MAG: L,D-transpeptidase family protein [Myxococcaceae bacterium]